MAFPSTPHGILLTMTTYGSWLRGDERGWVEDGRVRGAQPRLLAHDRAIMKYPPFEFERASWQLIGRAMGEALTQRVQQRILALAVRSWHVHFVVADSEVSVSQIVKCAKDSTRYCLGAGQPIWTAGYDKRFCFDEAALRARIEYVERHNTEIGLPARPWPFVVPLSENDRH